MDARFDPVATAPKIQPVSLFARSREWGSPCASPARLAPNTTSLRYLRDCLTSTRYPSVLAPAGEPTAKTVSRLHPSRCPVS